MVSLCEIALPSSELGRERMSNQIYFIMEQPTRIFEITKGFAKFKQIPMYFVAKPLVETARAYYLYGHGTLELVRSGICCECGRELTHPVSVKLGIGPICGAHYWDWNTIGGFSEENIERLKLELGTRMKNIQVDCWVPKSVVVRTLTPEEEVTVPPEHPQLNYKPGNLEPQKPQRRCEFSQRLVDQELVVKIVFPYNQEDLNRVRSLPSRKYHSEHKYWSTPLSEETVLQLKGWGFTLDDKLIQYLKDMDEKKLHVNQVSEIEVPGLRKTLYPFQKRGVGFIEAKNGRALVGDEMGLGKTMQALAWMQLHPEKRPVIIVVPASLKLNWEREIMAWMTDWGRIEILQGTKPTPMMLAKLKPATIIIINYDILSYWVDELLKLNPKVLITDECHYYKNNKAKRTKAIKKLGKHISHVIALSGTPIVNRPEEMLNAIQLIDPAIMPNRWDYLRKYCGAKYNGYGWDFSGATNTGELHEKLTNSIMIRRKKSDVLPDLPDKVRSFIPLELDNASEYNRAEADFIEFVSNTKGQEAADRASNAATLAEIEGLKQLAVRGKMNQVIDWIKDFLDVDGKLVVFATHKFVIDRLQDEFMMRCVKVDGSVTGENRQKAVDRFQTDDSVRLFIGNIKAAGVGITLTASSNVAFIELPWTPGDVTQAEDRVHRIGQKDSVNIHYLLANGTIEEKIARLIDSKRKVLDAVLDGVETESESLLSELMKEYQI